MNEGLHQHFGLQNGFSNDMFRMKIELPIKFLFIIFHRFDVTHWDAGGISAEDGL